MGSRVSGGQGGRPAVVLVLGASARAAAFSAWRGGARPFCVDRFADRDLSALCPVECVPLDAPNASFAAIAERLPPSPWFYTGGLENDPNVIEQIAARHRLWGACGDALRAARDPIALARLWKRAGIPAPEARLDPQGLPRDGSWLRKPLASAGGVGVSPFRGRLSDGSDGSGVVVAEERRWYYQRRVPGRAGSALFIGQAGTGACRLIGATRQWSGSGTNEGPLLYRGNLGPCRPSDALAARLRAIGELLTRACGLAGWFGVDFILRDGVPWPIEVNPRYTASVEIHELARGWALIDAHRRACEGVPLDECVPDPNPIGPPVRFIAKRVVYAARPIVVPDDIPLRVPAGPFDVPALADVPAPGAFIAAGQPVLTVFAAARSPARCRARAVRRERFWRKRLEGEGQGEALHGARALGDRPGDAQ